MPNRLLGSASPYLAQHADNPVDWWPWSTEAIQYAQEKDLPIFLSIGYSSCHWCHVMAHESFENDDVAKLLNKSFVSIKVDREELPNVDETYMTALMLVKGQGGWPLSAFLTPDLKPFFLGTYFPLEDRGSHPGFKTIVSHLAGTWNNPSQREQILTAASDYAQALEDLSKNPLPPAASPVNQEFFEQATRTILQDFDPQNGGFGGAPKFPPHTALGYLLAFSQSTRMDLDLRNEALVACLFTLERMALSGLQDWVGGGFHRYSTDANWHLPHFEKMLTDNALLARLYLRAAQILAPAGDPETAHLFQSVAQRIFAWLNEELLQANQLYGSATNADSEGEEGTFFVWSKQEIQTILGNSFDNFATEFPISEEGNFLDEATRVAAGKNVIDPVGNEPTLYDALELLKEARNRREKPSVDTKALTHANALLALALHQSGDSQQAAAILTHLTSQSTIARTVGSDLPGFLEDYAATAWLSATLNQTELTAKVITQMDTQFKQEGLYYSTSPNHDELFGRRLPLFDQPVPSGSALAVAANFAAGNINQAALTLKLLSGWMERAPFGTAALLEQALLLWNEKPEFLEPLARITRVEETDFGTRITVTTNPSYHLQPTDAPAEVATAILRGSERLPTVLETNEPGQAVVSFTENADGCRLRIQLCTENTCLAPIELPLRKS